MQAAELLFLICNLSLKEHLEQLQFLYDSIPQKKRVLVKKGNQFIGTMAGLHDVNNPNSGRVMQKIGMKYEGTLRQSGKNNQGIVDSARYSLIKVER